ncbi:MAG: hypothetical protein J7J15_03585, partial [Candidatus Aenigmarchaeota archaeon]|nr:hypothetical protein [Candidatus Aenigmarchaeota archaeon]
MFGSIFDIIGFLIFMVFIFLFPRMMLYQILTLLNAKVQSYEEMTNKAQKIIIKKIDKKTKLTKKQLKNSIDRIMEYFVV